MKRLWKKHLDRITNNVLENFDTYVFGAVMFGFIAVSDFVLKMYRHRTSLEDYSWSFSMLLLALVYGYFLTRARAVRRLRDGDSAPRAGDR